MVYVDFTAGNKDYKLRLNTRNTIALEKNLLDSENRLLFTDEIYKERFPVFGK